MAQEQEPAVDHVLRLYPLREPRVVSLMEASNRNESYSVVDSAGQKHVLRRYRRNREPARVAFQLRFQRHLLANGFPTAPIVLSNEGTDFVLHDDIPWALFKFVEGSEYDFERLGQVAEAGRRLAEFHAIADSFVEPPIYLDWEPPPEYYWLHNETERMRLRGLFRSQDIGTEVEWLLAWWEDLMHAWPLERYAILPAGWIHRDYHGRNVVFVGDEIKGLFDFDLLMWAPRVHDVARGLFMFARESRGSRRVRAEAARLFFETYSQGRAFAPEELAAVPALLVMAFAPTVSWLAYRQRDEGGDPSELLRGSVGYMRELQSEMERLAPEFGWSV